MSEMDAITIPEGQRLDQLEKQISAGIQTFNEVGSALMEIRDARLYRSEFKTFENYCREKWGMSRSRAHRLIEASSVVEMLPIGNTPTTESQVRPLTTLPPNKQTEAWGKAVETAGGGQPTAKQVEAAVDEIQLPKRERISYKPDLAMQIADQAIDRLHVITDDDKSRNAAFQKVITFCQQKLSK